MWWRSWNCGNPYIRTSSWYYNCLLVWWTHFTGLYSLPIFCFVNCPAACKLWPFQISVVFVLHCGREKQSKHFTVVIAPLWLLLGTVDLLEWTGSKIVCSVLFCVLPFPCRFWGFISDLPKSSQCCGAFLGGVAIWSNIHYILRLWGCMFCHPSLIFNADAGFYFCSFLLLSW